MGLGALHNAVWMPNDPDLAWIKGKTETEPGLDCLRYATWNPDGEKEVTIVEPSRCMIDISHSGQVTVDSTVLYDDLEDTRDFKTVKRKGARKDSRKSDKAKARGTYWDEMCLPVELLAKGTGM